MKKEEMKLVDEGYKTGKHDAIKECIMLVGTYGIKDPESEESKIYMQSREDAIATLRKCETDISQWSWLEAYEEVMSLKDDVQRLAVALKEAVDEPDNKPYQIKFRELAEKHLK